MTAVGRARRGWSRPFGAALVILSLALVGVTGCGEDSSSAASQNQERIGSAIPIVLIILDELPNANIMTRDGQRVDSRRFPRLAAFARQSTWYRDNVAAGDFTAWAVPPIFTGNLSDEETLPTTDVQPDNIFTLLGPGRRMHVLEPLTELCPKSLCPKGHQGEAKNEVFADDFVKAKFKAFEPAEVNQWIRGIPAGNETLSVAHMEVPHQPLRFTPEGKTYRPGPLNVPTDLSVNGWTVNEPAVAFVQHRHLLQTGFADRIIGNTLAKIRRNGDFDRALIVITADHGNSFDPHDLRRDVTSTNPGATVNPPLFIKYPGQKKGRVSTASTQAIDIFPTIAEEIGARIPDTDGMPVSQARPDRVMTVSKDVMREIQFTAADIRADRKGVLADQYRRLGAGPLWRLGPRSHLIGRRPGPVRTLPGSRAGLYVPGARIRMADGSHRSIPALISGRLAGVGAGKVLALAWSGTIVATTRSFEYAGKVQFGAMVPPAVMRRGRNRVDLYLVGAGDRLRRIP